MAYALNECWSFWETSCSYLFSVVAARGTERGLQSAGVLVSEGGFGILRARLCAAHVPAGYIAASLGTSVALDFTTRPALGERYPSAVLAKLSLWAKADRRKRELLVGPATQGGSRCAPLPWATFTLPLRGGRWSLMMSDERTVGWATLRC